jgi:hypothetical protein
MPESNCWRCLLRARPVRPRSPDSSRGLPLLKNRGLPRHSPFVPQGGQEWLCNETGAGIPVCGGQAVPGNEERAASAAKAELIMGRLRRD